ncbi:disease resistance protein RUN1 [Ziziphus jujuba]|uniref:Disease resistance protein RUN1 n=1 Tax=Ziziphus jujuba TaxID=326968 RepID=A0ABM3ZXH0_ZIZJJ|nr:disease resistance protein RUN1 [Ziziphus jujuba]
MTSETCSNSSFSSPWKYHVFLSFKEEDTGKSFTDHLYNALNKKGIITFRDDDQKLGSLVPSKAIEESRFTIVVFSENYASSTRCLDQLVKIAECKKDLRLEAIYPVLYDVVPTQLIVECGKACFAERQQVFKDIVEKVKKWEGALTEVINLSRSRWDLKDRVKHKFDATAFIANVTKECKKNDIIHLQKRLYEKSFKIQGYVRNDGPGKNLLRRRLLSKRLLIVLDDVDSSKQIQDLVGNWKVENWLGRGSRVIVTSKNKHVLNQFGDKYIYEVDKLTDDEALQVLRVRAFADNYFPVEYEEDCNNIVKIAHGNPLQLVDLGNFLRGRPQPEWSDEIAKRERVEDEDEDEECN